MCVFFFFVCVCFFIGYGPLMSVCGRADAMLLTSPKGLGGSSYKPCLVFA